MSTLPPSKRISLQRTEGEWQKIEQILKDKGIDWHSYIRRESSRLVNEHKACDVCVSPAEGEIDRRRHNIPIPMYEELSLLAARMGKDVGTVIDEFLLTPLLLQGKDAAL